MHPPQQLWNELHKMHHYNVTTQNSQPGQSHPPRRDKKMLPDKHFCFQLSHTAFSCWGHPPRQRTHWDAAFWWAQIRTWSLAISENDGPHSLFPSPQIYFYLWNCILKRQLQFGMKWRFDVQLPLLCRREAGGRGWRPQRFSIPFLSFRSNRWIKIKGSISSKLLLAAEPRALPRLEGLPLALV